MVDLFVLLIFVFVSEVVVVVVRPPLRRRIYPHPRRRPWNRGIQSWGGVLPPLPLYHRIRQYHHRVVDVMMVAVVVCDWMFCRGVRK